MDGEGEKGQLNVRELLSNLPLSVVIRSAHVCDVTCSQKLKKRQVLKDQKANLILEIKTNLCGQSDDVRT